MNYKINGGHTHRIGMSEWHGGERYGGEADVYYAEYRGEVQGAEPGDSVEVWFTAVEKKRGPVESEHFTYTVASDSGADVLIVANEDYTGVNPTYPAGTTAPKYADDYAAALDANGISHETFDVDAQGIPHPLGVLGHFAAVVWEIGDDRLSQDPEDEITDTFLFGPLPDLAVAERQQYLTLAVRDYLNEGGKLLQTGETTGYFGLLGGSIGGIYYGLDGAPEEDCVVTGDFFSDCLLLADDFHQYYLGASGRATFEDPGGVVGTGPPLDGAAADFGGQAVVDNPLDEAGAFTVTSDLLPADEFPLFASTASSTYVTADGVNPFGPVEGVQYAGVLHADGSYMRLTRTIDLTSVAAADAPALAFQLSWNTELGYDNVIVEAAPAGTDAWTTLPESGGATSTTPPDRVRSRLPARHASVPHPRPDGWQPVRDDWVERGVERDHRCLRRLAAGCVRPVGVCRRAVDVSISYVTDPGSGGIGVFVDDTRVTTTAGGARRRRVRGPDQPLDDPGRAGGEWPEPGRLRDLDRAGRGGRLGDNRRFGAARLRHRAARHAGRAGRRARPHHRVPARLTRPRSRQAGRSSSGVWATSIWVALRPSPIAKRTSTCTVTLPSPASLSGSSPIGIGALQPGSAVALPPSRAPSERASSWYQPVNAIATNVPSVRSTAIGSWPRCTSRAPSSDNSIPIAAVGRSTIASHRSCSTPSSFAHGPGGGDPLPYVTEVEPMSICTAVAPGRRSGEWAGSAASHAATASATRSASSAVNVPPKCPAAGAPVERQASNVSPSTDSHSPSGTPVRPPPLR